MSYEIVMESNLDLNKELRDRFNFYKEYIHNIVYLPNGEISADLDYTNFTPKQYFTIIKKNAGRVKTAFAPYAEFKRVVEPILQEGKDVIIPTISSAISGTYNGFKGYAEELLQDYKGRKIEIVDTLRYGSAGGLLAIYMTLNRDNKGMSFEDNIKWANENRYRIHESGPMDDLRFLAKNGRISATKAFFGQLVGVQPFADFTHEGTSAPLGTLKGEDVTNKAAIEYLMRTATNLDEQVVLISHSDRLARANTFKELLLNRATPKEVYVLSVGESCGPNIGPGLCAYFYLGESIKDGREVEQTIFDEIKGK